ncbi:MAG: hypothetical protein NZM12_14260, partial [Steroidobacteraceae bacterium]|nr:hypothetical protein [Steroidobacteraceae bacterium]
MAGIDWASLFRVAWEQVRDATLGEPATPFWSFVERVQDAFRGTFDAVREFVIGVDWASVPRTAWQRIRDVVPDEPVGTFWRLVEWTQSSIVSTYEAVRDFVAGVQWSQIWDRAVELMRQFTPAGAVDALRSFVLWCQETIVATYEATRDFIEGIDWAGLPGYIWATLNDWSPTLAGFGERGWALATNIAAEIRRIWDDACQAVREIDWAALGRMIADKIRDGAAAIREAVRGLWSGLTDVGEPNDEGKEAARNTVQNLIDNIKSELEAQKPAVSAELQKWFDDVVQQGGTFRLTIPGVAAPAAVGSGRGLGTAGQAAARASGAGEPGGGPLVPGGMAAISGALEMAAIGAAVLGLYAQYKAAHWGEMPPPPRNPYVTMGRGIFAG